MISAVLNILSYHIVSYCLYDRLWCAQIRSSEVRRRQKTSQNRVWEQLFAAVLDKGSPKAGEADLASHAENVQERQEIAASKHNQISGKESISTLGLFLRGDCFASACEHSRRKVSSDIDV